MTKILGVYFVHILALGIFYEIQHWKCLYFLGILKYTIRRKGLMKLPPGHTE